MVLYHATHQKNLPSIMLEGIHPGTDGCVYLTEEFGQAASFALLHNVPQEDVVVLECHLPDSRVYETFDHSRNYFDFPCFGYPKTINPSQIKKFLEIGSIE